jgi:hypothetical protein
MKEIHLYACDVCSTIKMEYKSAKPIRFVWCHVCKECQFHNKIVVEVVQFEGFGAGVGERHYGFMLEEKKNADSNEKDDKEGKAHVD